MFDDPPCFDRLAVEAMVRELLGVAATASPLPSERDQNFLLTVDGQPRLVWKIANPSEDRAFLAAEQAAQATEPRYFATRHIVFSRAGSRDRDRER